VRKIVNSTFTSLDGVVNFMDRWHFDFVDAQSDAIALEQAEAADAVLMGRKTYESFAAVWPTLDTPTARLINASTKYVASTTLSDPAWANTTVLHGDLVGEVAKLKAQPGRDILMYGYGPVAKTLMAAGLLDELCVWVHPHLAGVGDLSDTLFSEGLDKRLSLTAVRPLDSGVVLLAYDASSKA
jgi:dihydrofolate reductase